MSVVANPVKNAINRRAQQKYATFWNSLVLVDGLLDDARKLAARIDDSDAPPWHAASREDVLKSVRRVERSIAVLGKNAKRWEAELISRDWRK